MIKKKQTDVLVSIELAEGLVAVLESALIKGQLKGREKRLASAYAELLALRVQTNENNARISLSITLIANILRIILIVLVPDPLVKGLIKFISKVK